MTDQTMTTTIRDLREKRGLTQGQLAQLAQVSYLTISRIENRHPVSRIYIARVCKALDANIDCIEGLVFSQRKVKGVH